jgi:hypothetical protein
MLPPECAHIALPISNGRAIWAFYVSIAVEMTDPMGMGQKPATWLF